MAKTIVIGRINSGFKTMNIWMSEVLCLSASFCRFLTVSVVESVETDQLDAKSCCHLKIALVMHFSLQLP